MDRAGVSKGYGFVTFETEQEAQRLQSDVIFKNLVVYFLFFLFSRSYKEKNMFFRANVLCCVIAN